jgi:hypothetical protein
VRPTADSVAIHCSAKYLPRFRMCAHLAKRSKCLRGERLPAVMLKLALGTWFVSADQAKLLGCQANYSEGSRCGPRHSVGPRMPTSVGVTAPDEVTGSLGSAGPGLGPATDKPGGRCVSDVTSNAPTMGDGTGEGLAWDEAGRESSGASEIEFAMLLRLRGFPGLPGLKPVGWPSRR